jgi:hypothetical protein
VELAQALERIAALARSYADAGEEVAGVLAAEAEPGERVYVCAFARGETRSWLALDSAGEPLADRSRVRSAVAILALCELAEETAGGGDLGELRSQLVALRVTENPPGIAEAEDAALALEAVVGAPPQLATPARLDAIGAATRRLERALGEGTSPFATAMQQAAGAVEELTGEVEAGYKRPFA